MLIFLPLGSYMKLGHCLYVNVDIIFFSFKEKNSMFVLRKRKMLLIKI